MALSSSLSDAIITVSALLPVGHVYDVHGRVSVPSIITGGEYTVELEVFVDESLEATRLFAQGDLSTRFFALRVGTESLMRDQFGSPIPFAIDHATMTYPMLFRVALNGSTTEIFYHSEESTRSLTLKRALVSSLQLARVERSALASGPLLFSATEEDKDGPAKADYIVRRGLIGRTTYIKHSTYEPTRRRPPQIVQTTDAVAIYGRDGSLLRLSTSLHFRTNFSGRPDGDMDEIRHNITGLDHLPRDPSAYTWRLRLGGDLHSTMGPRGGRRLATQVPSLARFSFVCSTLRADETEDDTELEICTVFRPKVSALLQCLVDGPTPEPERANCSSKLIHGAVACPALHVDSQLGRALASARCLGPQDPEARLCDLLVLVPPQQPASDSPPHINHPHINWPHILTLTTHPPLPRPPASRPHSSGLHLSLPSSVLRSTAWR